MPAHPEAVDLALAAVAGAEDRKATDLVVLDVADLMAVVDVFVLATTRNERQLKAAVDSIEEQVRERLDRRPRRREGTPASGWFLLDYGDVVCHVFDDDRRAFYDLDRLWADVPQRDPHTGEVTEASVGTGSRRGDESAS